jgi:preprotein translocase subunit SecA
MRGIKHEVLNAKYHEKEAYIVTRAGQYGAVTVATNMAGRGTDILLGEGVPEIGGLHVLGTERHEARRIDNQLRGRCARQGDPGSSQFFMSVDDDLFRKFAPPWMKAMLQKMGLKEGERIESRLVTRAIGKAQKNVESHNFDIRKNLVEYDQVRNEQRKVIYGMRQKVLDGMDVRAQILEFLRDRVYASVDRFWPKKEEPDLDGLAAYFESKYGVKPDVKDVTDRDMFEQRLLEWAERSYAEREKTFARGEVRNRLEGMAKRFLQERGTTLEDAGKFCHAVENEFGVPIEPAQVVNRERPEAVEHSLDRIAGAKPDLLAKVGHSHMRAADRKSVV